MSVVLISVIIVAVILIITVFAACCYEGGAYEAFMPTFVVGVIWMFVILIVSVADYRTETKDMDDYVVLLGEGEVIVYAGGERFILTTLKEAEEAQSGKKAYLEYQYSHAGNVKGVKLKFK